MDASVIVIDWHQPALTRRALDSLLAQRTEWRFEIVLVVNEADDATVADFESDYPSVRIVPERTNSGFAGGVALGLRASSAPVVVLVNNDAVADHGFLERGRVMLAASDERVGALAATAVLEGAFEPVEPDASPSDDDLVSASGARWRRLAGHRESVLVNGTGVVLDSTGNGRDRDWLAPLDGPRETARIFGFSGGAAFLRRAALDDIGGFDPWLFMYYEDVDVSWRLRLAGYDIRSVPDAVVVHRHAASSASNGVLVRSQSMRNRLAVVLRNGSPAFIARVLARTVVRAALDLVRPATAQLPPSEWRRLGREAPGLVRHAWHLRRLDAVGAARRREVERRFLESAR